VPTTRSAVVHDPILAERKYRQVKENEVLRRIVGAQVSIGSTVLAGILADVEVSFPVVPGADPVQGIGHDSPPFSVFDELIWNIF
jgi:hypothetical protein